MSGVSFVLCGAVGVVAVLGLWVWAFVLGRPQRAAWRAAQRPQPRVEAGPPPPRPRVGRGLPPGEDGHYMFAVALHEVSGRYLEECQRRAAKMRP